MTTITRQIIRDVVKEEIGSALKPLEQKFDNLEQKIDTVITQITDIAGQFKKFDEEQTVLSGQMSDRTDRIEKLETAVFGSAAA
ncbi:MAG: hypothetical protein UV10_C0033G0010 [Candidatus Azambacteria bacterium GW2011_GWA1_42_19]|uniref:Uncharacterized protein n=1 Tax=Candidatus Azambacteria bacterium GW2011_GWA1_42_19 TaxID=1618609 RepID=A0A0G0Z8Z1_9BACT|nr:MAG: hypothetical protein UV10_C0033G0010 [Candidatus Azambacteria bacterium GW2011_GWA1_42_19]